MDTAELKKLAERTRFMREAGITLLLASGLLAVLFFIPIPEQRQPSASAETAPASIMPSAFANTAIEAKAAIVYDLATNETLFAKNADTQLPLASLTKLLTVYAALSEFSSQTPITISAQAAQLEAPRAFSPGETFAFSDLARLTLTASLNDGAAAIAETAAARAQRPQREILASAAAALALSQTFAVNGSGLDITTAVSGGYGSARDLAKLAGALADKAPAIAEATTYEFTRAVSKDGTVFKVRNTDPIVSSIPNLKLSKTGFTDLAGGNLALVFDAGIRHPVAIVVLGSSKAARFTDGMSLVAATMTHLAATDSL